MSSPAFDPFVPEDFTAVLPDEPIPEDAAAIDLFAERRMWRIRQLRAEQGRNVAQAEEIAAPLRARLEMVEVWLADQNAALQRQVDFLVGQVEQAALSYPWGEQKSRKMPAGTFGQRLTPEHLTIHDKDSVVAWAEAEGLTDLVRVKKEPNAKAVGEYFQSTGNLPRGCVHVGAYDKPYVKVE